MNSPITFPPAAPVLKLARPSAEKWAATLAEERRRLQEDLDALREREENLREYEARLRALQAEIEASRGGSAAPVAHVAAARGGTTVPFIRPSSRSPFVDGDAALQAAWEKLHRARELLEAEQVHLRDDRIAMREQEATMKRREDAIAEREARVAEREALVVAANAPLSRKQGEAAATEGSTVSMLTTAPFKMARAVLRGKK